jgi:protein TonB
MKSRSLLMLAVALLASPAAAQDALEEAKAQYAAASYEEALSTLARVDVAPAARRVETEQYRAFCLIALGRTPDAERAVASLVATDPSYVPSPSVASPKVLQLVSEMRRKELPGVARKLLEDGRTAFKEKQFEQARQQFALLLQVLDDPALKGRPEVEDMRVLADGFVALATASAAPPPAPPAAAPVETIVQNEPVIEPPIAVQQTLPEWQPPDRMAASRDYVGAIKVRIGVDGRVKSAAIQTPTNPTYDARLLAASRAWVYRPATRNGTPVESEKVIAVQLRRRD